MKKIKLKLGFFIFINLKIIFLYFRKNIRVYLDSCDLIFIENLPPLPEKPLAQLRKRYFFKTFLILNISKI